MYRKRDGERELLKDRWLSSHLSLHLALCLASPWSRGVLLSPLEGDSSFTILIQGVPIHFQLLLLGTPKKEVATHIQCLACSAHSGHPPPSLCSPQSPAASVEGVGWPARGSEVSRWERGTAPCPPPETPQAVAVKEQQHSSRSGQPLEAACSAHTVMRAGGEAPHSLQGELFKSIK